MHYVCPRIHVFPKINKEILRCLRKSTQTVAGKQTRSFVLLGTCQAQFLIPRSEIISIHPTLIIQIWVSLCLVFSECETLQIFCPISSAQTQKESDCLASSKKLGIGHNKTFILPLKHALKDDVRTIVLLWYNRPKDSANSQYTFQISKPKFLETSGHLSNKRCYVMSFIH